MEKIKVLVVDDQIDMRMLFQAVAASLGYEVKAYEGAEEAWEEYQKEYYHIVILDWLLPGLDGLTLCRRMRKLPHGERSVILVVTGRSSPDDLYQVLQSGADDYLAKPVDIDILSVRLSIAQQHLINLIKRKEAEEAQQKSYDDLLSILNQLRVGTAIIDEKGNVTFLSQIAKKLFFQNKEFLLGHWEKLFPLDLVDKEKLKLMMEMPNAKRNKIPVKLNLTDADLDFKNQLVEIEVQDDPRNSNKKILCFYDVSEVHNLRRMLDEKAQFDALVGKSQPMKVLYQKIKDVSQVDATVLIEGETGTGKELVAKAIHNMSPRNNKPFVAVNCAGLTESLLASQLFGHKKGAFTGAIQDQQGLFEAANGGTLFLDEIGDIPMSVQIHLLRVLQEREIIRLGESKPRKINVRVLTATHRNLVAEVEKGNFRQDLLYRIRVARINLPPLKERREDIPLLVSKFLADCRISLGKDVEEISNEALRLLMSHNWPGNVRELKSAIEFAMIYSKDKVIIVNDLPPEIAFAQKNIDLIDLESLKTIPSLSIENKVENKDNDIVVLKKNLSPEKERERLLLAIEKAGGNRKLAAQLLGMSRATFYRRLANAGIQLEK